MEEHQPDLPLGLWGKRERAEEARSLLGSQIFGLALNALRDSYIEQMVGLQLQDPALFGLHAKMKALEDVVGELQGFITERQFDLKWKNGS